MRNYLPAALALCSAFSSPASAEENMALQKPVTFHPTPNYSLSSDPDDALQLTDGSFAPSGPPMWAETAAVAWRREELALITIDLGEAKPIGEVVFYSGSRKASGVSWASNLVIYLSDDGVNWQEAGDICSMERARGTFPEPTTGDHYRTHRFVSDALNLKARYVAVAAKGAPYIAVDEIEVLRGEENALPITPQITGVDGIRKAFRIANIWGAVTQRVHQDRITMRRAIQGASASASVKERLIGALEKKGAYEPPAADFDPETFRATFPLTKEHEKIFAIQAELWRESGHKAALFYTAPRYDWVPLFHSLPDARLQKTKLLFQQMQGERRSALLLISNPAAEPVTFKVKVEADEPLSGAVKIYDSRWTDTPDYIAVADVLLPLASDEVMIPAGMTQKIWVTLDTKGIPEGTHYGALIFTSDAREEKVPLESRVSPVVLKPAKLATGMWDYVLKQNIYGVTPANYKATAQIARDGGVNVAWIPRSVLPWPENSDFLGKGETVSPLNFSALRERIKSTWPDADIYAFFLGEAVDLGGASLGSEKFTEALGEWLKEFEAALKEVGVPIEKVMLLTIDEPLNEEKAARSLAWTKAIRATGSEVKIFTDPVWYDFKSLPKDYIEAVDIVCPNIQFLQKEGPEVMEYFERLRTEGKELWFYICSGPVREVDPARYYRLAHWYVFHHQGKGIGFWSLSDTGGAVSSWLGHTATNTAYSPLFLSPESADISIHWEAIQEGRLDFSYFTMLREAKISHPKHEEEIDSLLSEVAKHLNQLPRDTGNGAMLKDGFWPEAKTSQPIEELRLRALELLEKLR